MSHPHFSLSGKVQLGFVPGSDGAEGLLLIGFVIDVFYPIGCLEVVIYSLPRIYFGNMYSGNLNVFTRLKIPYFMPVFSFSILKKNCYILFGVLLASTFNSCVKTQNRSTDKTVYVQVSASSQLEILAGDIVELVNNDSLKIAKVHFEKVSGGATYLFGKIKYNEVHGDTEPRLSILRDSAVISTYSLNEVIRQPAVELDSFTIFILE